jgi:hypothetical protein
MGTKLYLPITILCVALLCMGFQCDSDEPEIQFNFREKINLFPAQKSYRVGDTIWLSYTNPNKQLFDNRTSSLIAADTLSVQFQVMFNCRYNTPVNPADGFCDFVTANGLNAGRYLSNSGTGFFDTFGCNSSNHYEFTIGIVPKQKGIYSLDLSDPRSVLPCSGRISVFPRSNIEYRFNLSDGNKDIYLTIPSNARGETPKGSTEKKIDNKQVYFFSVV